MPTSRNRRYSHYSFEFERRCTQCLTWLPENRDYFGFNSVRDLYNSWCKPCVAAHRTSVTSRRLTPGSRNFGVEIEFIGSANQVAAEMNRRGLRCEVQAYNHNVSRTTWKIVPDGSVSRGAELVSPILNGQEGYADLLTAGQALVAAGAASDRTTGLHVHHEVTRLTVTALQTLVRNWFETQDAIDELVCASRRLAARNDYISRLEEYEVQNVERLSSVRNRSSLSACLYTRYRNLNLCSFPRYGTVEVRQHQGTVDGQKMVAWVKFGQAMIESACAGTELRQHNGRDLVDALPLEDSVKSYLNRRITQLAEAAVRPRVRRRQSVLGTFV